MLLVMVRVESLGWRSLNDAIVVILLRMPFVESSKDSSQDSRTRSLLKPRLIFEVVDTFISVKDDFDSRYDARLCAIIVSECLIHIEFLDVFLTAPVDWSHPVGLLFGPVNCKLQPQLGA